MVEMKWQSLMEADPNREYLAFSEMAKRKNLLAYFSWLMRARKVSDQLKTAKGLVGFTARLGFWNKQVIMLAAFENESALKAFAHGWATCSMHGTNQARSKGVESRHMERYEFRCPPENRRRH